MALLEPDLDLDDLLPERDLLLLFDLDLFLLLLLEVDLDLLLLLLERDLEPFLLPSDLPLVGVFPVSEPVT